MKNKIRQELENYIFALGSIQERSLDGTDCKRDSDKTEFYAEDRSGFDRVNRSGQPDLGNDPIGLLPL